MFHCLACCCADALIGGAGSKRSKDAWRQVYRALEHGHAEAQCRNKNSLNTFHPDIQRFASTFVSMQAKRHMADYDPYFRAYKSAVQIDITMARFAIRRLMKAPMLERRAFATLVLLKPRKS